MKNNNVNYNDIENSRDLKNFWKSLNSTLLDITHFDKSLFFVFSKNKLNELNSNNEIDLTKQSLISTAFKSSFPIILNYVENSFTYNQEIDNPMSLDLKNIMIVPLACCDKHLTWSIVVLYRIKDIPFTKDEIEDIEDYLYNSSGIIMNNTSEISCQHIEKKHYIDSNSIQILKDRIDRQQQFFSSTIHDIRTPINSIMGFLELLNLDEKKLEKKEYIDLAFKSSQTVTTLINDVLDISKIEAGKLDINIRFTSIIQEFEDLSLLFSYMTSKKKIDFIVCYDPIVPYIIRTDIDRIKQIIGNLLSNAIKFTPIGGYIKFKIKYQEKIDEIMICIEDSGIGISKEHQKHIFEPFKQASETTSSNYGGTGLGLSISKELASLLGGKLQIESKENEGSKFYFNIPCKSVPFTPETIDRDRFKDIDINIFSPRDDREERVYLFICQYFKRLDIKYNILDISSIDVLKDEYKDKEVFIFIDFKQEADKEYFENLKKRLLLIEDINSYKKFNNKNITIIPQPVQLSNLFDNIENNKVLKEQIDKIKNSDIVFNILIVDDNMINLKLMGEIIKKIGHKPYLADCGTKVLDLMDNNHIDIAFIDQHMPDIDGDEVIINIRKNPKYSKVKIYGLTGSSDEEVTNKMTKAGAEAILTKPIHIDTIVNILDKTIQGD